MKVKRSLIYIFLTLISLISRICSLKENSFLRSTSKLLEKQIQINTINQFSNNDGNLRKDKDINKISFIFVKAYIDNIKPNTKPTVQLYDLKIDEIKSDKNPDKKIKVKRFIYLDKSSNSSLKIKVCVPLDKSVQPYLDIFCPFTECIDYSTFLSRNLDCIENLSDSTRKKIRELNNAIN